MVTGDQRTIKLPRSGVTVGVGEDAGGNPSVLGVTGNAPVCFETVAEYEPLRPPESVALTLT